MWRGEKTFRDCAEHEKSRNIEQVAQNYESNVDFREKKTKIKKCWRELINDLFHEMKKCT